MYKRKIFHKAIIGTFMAFSPLLYAKGVPLSEANITKLNQTVTIFKTRSNIRVIDGVDEGKYYFLQLSVKKGGRFKTVNAFLDKESGAVYVGHRYDKNGVKMAFPKTDKAIATIKEGISFSYGNGKKELYIVTDPECPYCKTFEKQAQHKLGDYTVHIILYPLSFHKKSPAMVEWIMQGKDDTEKKERMEAVMVNNSQDYEAFIDKKNQIFQYTDSIKTKVEKAVKAAKALGVTGTPSVYNESYHKISWKSLLASKQPVTQKIDNNKTSLKH